MIVAITYENGNVFMHYGKTRQFILFDVENNVVKSEKIIDCGEYSHHTLADLLALNGVEVLICGGCGAHAVETLNAKNIKIYNNVCGDVHVAIKEYLNGNLNFNGPTECGCHH
ncbi:MAG: hypothetical protein IKP77_01365 [Acholeplasmatales bacterium]|nr:hypothetical protein [Acholeplasmatales bacterium]